MASRNGYILKVIAFCFGSLLLIGIVIIGFRFNFFLSLLGNLLGGWALFLYRVLPEINVDWTALLSAVFCLGLLAFGTHRFGNW